MSDPQFDLNGPGRPSLLKPLLIDALRHLATDAVHQIAYIQGEALSIDELALQFDDVYPAIRRHLPASTEEAAAALAVLLKEMSGRSNADLWTKEALNTRPEWQSVRSLARAALASLEDAGEGAVS